MTNDLVILSTATVEVKNNAINCSREFDCVIIVEGENEPRLVLDQISCIRGPPRILVPVKPMVYYIKGTLGPFSCSLML